MQISMLNSTTNSQPIPTKFSEAISRTYMQVLTSGQADRLIGRTLGGVLYIQYGYQIKGFVLLLAKNWLILTYLAYFKSFG